MPAECTWSATLGLRTVEAFADSRQTVVEKDGANNRRPEAVTVA